MRNKLIIVVMTAMALSLVLLVGCADNKTDTPKAKSYTEQVIEEFVEDTIEDIIADNTPAEFATTGEFDSQVVTDEDSFPPSIPVYDMVIKDNLVYGLVNDGVLIHDLDDGSNFLIPSDEPLTAIADLGEKVAVAGSDIFLIEGDIVSDETFDLELDGPVTVLQPWGQRLFIGTTNGLYLLEFGDFRQLTEGVHVSALAVGDFGVWMGTAGQGLFYWNGDSFQKRFLRRDTSLFDNVTALAYNHNHLYLGTDKGLFVHDGGRWAQYSAAEGLPEDLITFINAEDYVIKIGTAGGPVTFFNNEFTPYRQLEGEVVYRLEKRGNSIIAATALSGLVKRSAGLVTTLYDGTETPAQIALEPGL